MAKDKPQVTFQDILDGLALQPGDFECYHSEVLVGIYMRPEQTAGGIYLTEKNRDEDKWQGKVGFIIAKGPAAFQDDPDNRIYFHGINPDIGQAVMYRISDGFSVDIKGIHCRLLEDVAIRGSVADPTIVY